MTAPAHKSLAEALAAFQAEAPTLHKSAEAKAGSYSYRYVDLADIVDVIRPIMAKHGLSFSAFPCIHEGNPALRYTLRHSGGDIESDVMSLMISKADAQGHGSAITYARRYALCAVLNIAADKDDDGAAAKAAADRAREEERERQQQRRAANGQGGLPNALVEQLAAAKAEAEIPAERLRMLLSSIGVDDVPERITLATIKRLTPEQAQQLQRIFSDAIDARAAQNA